MVFWLCFLPCDSALDDSMLLHATSSGARYLKRALALEGLFLWFSYASSFLSLEQLFADAHAHHRPQGNAARAPPRFGDPPWRQSPGEPKPLLLKTMLATWSCLLHAGACRCVIQCLQRAPWHNYRLACKSQQLSYCYYHRVQTTEAF
jgi:hypothetical protein